MEKDLTYQVQQLLLKNKIDFDKEELSFQIQSHPSYPSLHAITGVLDHFNIDNLALDVPVDEETLAQFPKSTLVQLTTDVGKEFAVITKNKMDIEAIFSAKKKSKLSDRQFLKQFTGIVVAVEKDENQEEVRNYNGLLGNSLIALMVIMLIGLVSLLKPDFFSIVYILLSFTGLLMSYSLMKQDLGFQTVIGNAFCSQTSEKNNCNAVLSSKGATLFGSYKLSDLSLIYFSVLVLSSLLLLVKGTNLALPYLLSVLALPITLYSIYYQYAVIKQWCALCLNIVVALWVQAGIVLYDISDTITTFSFSIIETLITSITLLAIVTSWNFLGPMIRKIQELEQTKIDYFKFKKNFGIFYTLLKKSDTIDTHISDTSEIVIGKKEASVSLTIITNPFCGHCKEVHTLVENLYKKHADDLQICIRFNVNSSDPKSDAVSITSRLLELYHVSGVATCLEAMHEIYNGAAPDDWLDKWKVCEKPELYVNTLKKEKEWCGVNKINFTPEILINGKSYPKEYDRGDLAYFIEDLGESCQVSTNDITESLEQVY